MLEKSGLDRRDRALATELAYGTIRRRLSLDWLIDRFSNRPASRLDDRVLQLLRIGLYQLYFMDRIPDHAAVNTVVELAKKKLSPGTDKFINAIMRRAIRERGKKIWPDRSAEEALFLSVYYSHPRWLVDLWLKELGVSETEQLLEADNRRPRVTLRTNTLKTKRDGLIETLTKLGVSARPGRLTAEAVLIEGAPPPEVLTEGLAYVQDEGSILVGRAAYSGEGSPGAGEVVIDVCAGPGGKATHLAQLMSGAGRIIAVDKNRSRLDLVAANARRLGIRTIEYIKADVAEGIDLPALSADLVLVDAPCSGLGVLARRPDARWRKEEKDIYRLAETQGDIMRESAKLVRPGGFLIYSVCTITEAETTGVVNRFLSHNKDFSLAPFDLKGPESTIEAPGGHLQLLPHVHGTDGMFIARLRRSS